MIVNIPTYCDVTDYTEAVVLDSIPLKLALHWNTRAEQWMLSIADSDDEPIISGIAVVDNYDLLDGHRNASLPAGLLIYLDETGEGPPGLDELGVRGQLIYIPEADLADLAG